MEIDNIAPALLSTLPELIEKEINNWRGVESKHLRDNQAADNGDGERQCAEHRSTLTPECRMPIDFDLHHCGLVANKMFIPASVNSPCWERIARARLERRRRFAILFS